MRLQTQQIVELDNPSFVDDSFYRCTIRVSTNLIWSPTPRFDIGAELKLVVTNRQIGLGQAVKVGENFGLRITRIGTIYDTIMALGGS